MTPTHQPTTRGINGSTSTRHVQRRVREDRVHGSLLSRQRDRAHRDQLADRRAASRVRWLSQCLGVGFRRLPPPTNRTLKRQVVVGFSTCLRVPGWPVASTVFSDMLGPARAQNSRKLDMAFWKVRHVEMSEFLKV